MDAANVTNIFNPMFAIFENGYRFGQGLWAYLNLPISDVLGEGVEEFLPDLLANATLLEACFGPTFFVVLVLKIIQNFVPLS